MPRSETFLAAVHYLQEHGWPAIALCNATHQGVGSQHRRRCKSPGKVPLFAWKAWQDRLPPVEELEHGFGFLRDGNVGIVFGPACKLVGLDLDGVSAEALLKEASGGDVPTTPTFRTSRGRRLLFAVAGRFPPNRSLRRGRAELRVLSAGSISVMPPSIHASGRPYVWVKGKHADDIAVAPAPEWLYAIGRRPPSGRPVAAGEVIEEGSRNSTLFRLACAMRRHSCTADEILTALFVVNKRCEPPLSTVELQGIACSAAGYPPA
jgi:hypothetical protein